MIKRFFLNRVNVRGNRLAVDVAIECALEILPDPAKSVFTLGYAALMSAKEQWTSLFSSFSYSNASFISVNGLFHFLGQA